MYLINNAKSILIVICSLVFLSSSVAQIQVIRTVDIGGYHDIAFLGARNMDADANEELVFLDYSTFSRRVLIVDGNTSTIEWNSNTAGLQDIEIAGYFDREYTDFYINYGYNSPFCDINGDGIWEITFNASDGNNRNIYIVGSSGSSSAQNINIVPTNTKLQQNYPNPFNPTTTIEYEIQNAGNVEIKIFNELGQVIRTLINDEKVVGEYTAVWDGKNDGGTQVASGLYFYQLRVNDFVSTKKMILIK